MDLADLGNSHYYDTVIVNPGNSGARYRTSTSEYINAGVPGSSESPNITEERDGKYCRASNARHRFSLFYLKTIHNHVEKNSIFYVQLNFLYKNSRLSFAQNLRTVPAST